MGGQLFARGRGASLILLCLTAILVAILAWQALSAARSHRALAERVLHDYADLAATEFVRRSTRVVGIYGFAPALAGLVRTASPEGRLPTREAMALAIPGQSRRAMELVDELFRFDDRGTQVDESAEELSTEIVDALTLEARQPRGRRPDYCVTHPTIDRVTRSFVFSCDEIGQPGRAGHVGFAVRLDGLTAWLAEFVARDPLLPPALASRDAAQSALCVTVRSPDGRIVFRSPHEPPAAFVSVRRDMIGEGGETDLAGFEVEVAIDRSAADRLVIGGLPRSRVSLLLALMAVTIGLGAAAVVQIRRERDLALAREDFVTRASHELRTPVARIQMFTETLLLERVRSDAERHHALSALNRASRRLSFLLDNILRASHPEAVASAGHFERVDLAMLVNDVVAEFDSTLDDRGRIVVQGEPGIEAVVDREAFRQILLNLLDNADKYAGSRASILVDLRRSDAEARVVVQDQGPGIPPHERALVWLPYYRMDRDRRSAVAGTGIGLAVVHDLVAMHGGRHWIEEATGGGARFIIALPASLTPSIGQDAS
jgi:signal transduction histidine kinase